MGVLLEVVVGAVLSLVLTTGEVDQDQITERDKSEQVSEVSPPVECEE